MPSVCPYLWAVPGDASPGCPTMSLASLLKSRRAIVFNKNSSDPSPARTPFFILPLLPASQPPHT